MHEINEGSESHDANAPSDPGELIVHLQNARKAVPENRDSLLSIGGFDDFVAAASEQQHECDADQHVVIYDQNARHHTCARVAPSGHRSLDRIPRRDQRGV